MFSFGGSSLNFSRSCFHFIVFSETGLKLEPIYGGASRRTRNHEFDWYVVFLFFLASACLDEDRSHLSFPPQQNRNPCICWKLLQWHNPVKHWPVEWPSYVSRHFSQSIWIIPYYLRMLTNLPLLSVDWNTVGILQLHQNSFSGAIPSELGLLTQLANLELHGTDLTGEMPAEICELRSSGALASLTADCAGDNPVVSCPSGCCTACL